MIFPGHFSVKTRGDSIWAIRLVCLQPISCFSIPEAVIVNVSIVGIGFSQEPGISSIFSLLKTPENWLFSTSALALGSVNTSFPTLRSWISVPSFLVFCCVTRRPLSFALWSRRESQKDNCFWTYLSSCVIISWLIWTYSSQTAFPLLRPVI